MGGGTGKKSERIHLWYVIFARDFLPVYASSPSPLTRRDGITLPPMLPVNRMENAVTTPIQLTHSLTVSSANPAQLTPAQVWQGLCLRMLRPQWLLPQVDECELTFMGAGQWTRVLMMGAQQIRDRVNLSAPGRVVQQSPPGAQAPFYADIVMTWQPGLVLEFSYQRQGEAAVNGVDLNGHLQQAYQQMDEAFIARLCQWAHSGELARHCEALPAEQALFLRYNQSLDK